MKTLCENFHEVFKQIPESPEGVDGFLSNCDKKEKNLFERFVKVMEAETAADLEEFSLEELVELFPFQDTFCQAFEGKKAGHFFADVKNKISSLRNYRKRRVL